MKKLIIPLLIIACLFSCGKKSAGPATTPTVSIATVSTIAGKGTLPAETEGPAINSKFNGLGALFTDYAKGNIYLTGYNAIMRYRSGYIYLVKTLTNTPRGLCVDGSGNIYTADWSTGKIMKISTAGVLSTFSGSGASGSTNGPAANASFNRPFAMTIDAAGNIYVLDANVPRIRKITPDGTVSDFAGNALQGTADGQGASARFTVLNGITIDASGNIYVTDGSKVRKITPGGLVSTIADTFEIASDPNDHSVNATINPLDITIDTSGNIYVTDIIKHIIGKISPSGIISTLAGIKNVSGYVDGPADSAKFGMIGGISADAGGNIYVIDNYNDPVLRIITMNK